ncbi:MAG: Arc family DNA-binding protein [Mesorhizobium sp.]|nr:Arc family DNA-binding protein [Mesorhizobium sp.]MCO5160214.1 Arc family DNA-binding protein [Mesorhizobium sp.]
MGAIHVEGIEEKVLKSIALRAEQNGRSLDEEIRAILESAAGVPAQLPDLSHLKTRAERFAAIRAMTKGYSPETDSTEIIREMRDRGYSHY